MAKDPRDTAAGQIREAYDGWVAGETLKRLIRALLALFVVGYIAFSLFFPPNVVNAWKQKLFGPKQPAATQPAGMPNPTSPAP
jgi:hypothetical protein